MSSSGYSVPMSGNPWLSIFILHLFISPCRGLTKATYILCIEHPRLMRLSRESNQGELQANTLCKEPFERRYWLPFGTSACTTTAPPQATMSQALDWGSWLSLTRTRIYLIGRMEVRIAQEGARRSNLCCLRGSRALEPQNRVRIASRRGHHYVGAWPRPPTSSA